MKHLFKPQLFRELLALLILLLAVKLLWFVVEMLWLPASGVDQVEQKGGKALYYRVKLTPNETSIPSQVPAEETFGSIEDITLLAIYSASDATVVTVEYKSKTKVLSRGDEINGFVLEGAGSNFATFSKESKTYRVPLRKSKPNESAAKKVSEPSSGAAVKKVEGDVTDAGDHKIVDRSLLTYYASNMDDIYKNIGINEVKNGNELQGFRITFVRKDSVFSKLGVRRDDIIKSINGQEINSYNAAFNVYKNIANIDNMTLVIQRGKEEMELEYEVN